VKLLAEIYATNADLAVPNNERGCPCSKGKVPAEVRKENSKIYKSGTQE